MTHVLSKSTYLKGLQCKKALYFNKYHKDLKDVISESQQAKFSQGDKVGEPVRNYIPEELMLHQKNFMISLNLLSKQEMLSLMVPQ